MDLLVDTGYDSSESSADSSTVPKHNPLNQSGSTTSASSSESSTDEGENRPSKKSKRNHDDIVVQKSSNYFVRSVPHIIGNWWGHVFCSISKPPSLSRAATQEIQRWGRICNGVEIVPHERNELHISLSKPFYLPFASIEPFVSRLKMTFSMERAMVVSLLNKSEILVNDEGTRSFVTLPVVSGKGGVLRIMRGVDEVMTGFNLGVYYDDPNVHVSVASMRGDVKRDGREVATLAARRAEPSKGETNATLTSQDGKKTYSMTIDEEEGRTDSDDDSDTDEDDPPCTIPVIIDKICCTFGNSKRFTMNLIK